ncbi:transmembrane proteins 14C-domain-containing protein [Boletus reticuloceps]|uniref:Transmembrane proteins 14C-domain-containing protein n=1 Tax=Boletus reticuloceps TaxID=495285 RepID=A0A8I2Z0D3_9AGAM|nr:transmembrane proteins 14C-domain-containing protein [Boletus reticuloceps]
MPVPQSAIPAYAVGALCITGGVTGYLRTRSIPSIVAGIGVGVLYIWSAEQIKRGAPNGIEGALGASALLLVSSLPRLTKGPVPVILALASAGAGAYYGKTLYDLRNHAHVHT